MTREEMEQEINACIAARPAAAVAAQTAACRLYAAHLELAAASAEMLRCDRALDLCNDRRRELQFKLSQLRFSKE